jgi:hypothetical protein
MTINSPIEHYFCIPKRRSSSLTIRGEGADLRSELSIRWNKVFAIMTVLGVFVSRDQAIRFPQATNRPVPALAPST